MLISIDNYNTKRQTNLEIQELPRNGDFDLTL